MITIGGDSHKRTHTFVAIDDLGRQIAERTVAATSDGHLAALDWARQWPERRWALKDCRQVTRRLEGDLLRGGEHVLRVPTQLMAGARRSAREPGKSDPIDAMSVARAALREPGLPQARLDGRERHLKLLVDHREDLVGERTRIQSRLPGRPDIPTIYNWHSGGNDYGDHSLLAANFPSTDIALMVAPPGQTYTNVIYTGPSSPTERTVVGQRNAGLNEVICMSGQVSGARCNHWVVIPGAQHSYFVPSMWGPTSSIDVSWTALNDLSCREGDSGSPFYDRPGTTTARIMGLLTAIEDIEEWGVRACYFHNAGVVVQYGNYLTTW